jgi:hypothetical protein
VAQGDSNWASGVREGDTNPYRFVSPEKQARFCFGGKAGTDANGVRELYTEKTRRSTSPKSSFTRTIRGGCQPVGSPRRSGSRARNRPCQGDTGNTRRTLLGRCTSQQRHRGIRKYPRRGPRRPNRVSRPSKHLCLYPAPRCPFCPWLRPHGLRKRHPHELRKHLRSRHPRYGRCPPLLAAARPAHRKRPPSLRR